MSFLMNALAMAGKELRVLLKDKGALAVLFLLPLLFSAIMGGPQKMLSDVGETGPGEEPALQIEAYLVNHDSGPYGAQVADALSAITMLDIEALDTAEEADQLVADGERPAAIIIPAGFSAQIDAYTPTEIRLIVDPTEEEASSIVAGIAEKAASSVEMLGEIQYGIRTVMVESGVYDQLEPRALAAVQAQTLGVIWAQAQEIRQNPVIRVESKDVAGEEVLADWNPFSYLTPSFTVMFSFFLVGFVAEALLKEKESGAFRRLLSSPMQRGSIIAGKLLAYMAVVFLQVLVMFTVGNVLYNMPLGDSLVGIVVLTLALALTAASLGLMIGSLFGTSKTAGNAGTILGFVLMIIGGCIYPTFWEKGMVFYLSQLTPHAHAIDGYIKLMAEGAGVGAVLPNIGIMIGMAAAFFGIAMWRFKFE
ncbi:MAG: ABC transporter permease [Anaerolineales bacterium]|nr:ABC transporter permease [Anaerolineales bacterium]